MAKQKADERARMIENTKRQKNLEAEEAEQDDTLLEDDYDFDDDYDDDDEFTNAFTKMPEPVVSPPVKKKSNVFVPATGLKNSDRKSIPDLCVNFGIFAWVFINKIFSIF